jgi:hypothetical protein
MPTIKKPNQHFDATLYTGNGTSQTITNAGAFKPDFVWVKSRSVSGNPVLVDSVRGANKVLYSPQTTAEETPTVGTAILSFNSDGFSLGGDISGTSFGSTNGNTFTYVGWQWKAGEGTTTVNTSGTISSNVSVNATAGFSVVTYTGTGANATVGHGLGVAPRMMIIKRRNQAEDWSVYHISIGATNKIFLDLTNATSADSTMWNNTTPTSSLFSIGTNTATNTNTGTYVAYCWAEVEGYSKFGSYTGNGSADGPFQYTGFRPKFIMIKRTDSTSSWFIHDTARDTFNVSNKNLYPNLTAAEEVQTTWNQDILSNGFKIRGTSTEINASSATYIYAAFAEAPFKFSNAR